MSQANGPSISIEEYNKLFTEALRSEKALEQARSVRNVSREALLWMALAPGWTIPLAERCEFPARSVGVRATFEQLQRNGLVEVTGSSLPDNQKKGIDNSFYYMTETGRENVLSKYTSSTDKFVTLREALSKIGTRMIKAISKRSDTPAPLGRWAHLAANATRTAGSMSSAFDTAIEEAFHKKDSALISNWIETAKPLAKLFARDLDTEMELAVQRACRRLELLSRRKHDEQQLKIFLERREQEKALESLMTESDEHWALHYVGAGGMGKTMMMRHITVDLASKWKAAVARIDFDYLNADYPSRSPGLLLWSVAQELRAYDQKGQANRIFDKADDLLRKLHQQLRIEKESRRRRAIDDPIFVDALGIYIDACRALSRRIVLILDTCEELARVRPDNKEPENVEATFAILNALQSGHHEKRRLRPLGLPNMRVIFSGRRLLASRGYKWRAPASSLAERPFLRLHEIRGFTHHEAEKFLHDKLSVPKKLIKPIITRTPDKSRVVDVVWEKASDAPPDVPRCNPYELRLFGDWATEIPPPTADQITKASSAQYIETRIVQRLKDDLLERMLPLLTLLGHFDRDLFRAVATADDQTANTSFEKLQQQEWINPRLVTIGEGDQTRLILDMESGLRSRLLSHYSQRGRCPSELVARASNYLEKRTRKDDLNTLDWSAFDAAIRVLELDADQQRVFRWWDRVEERLVAERGFPDVIELIGRLQGKDGAVCPRDKALDPEELSESRLRPSVLASYASALLNTGKGSETIDVWREVYTKAKALSGSERGFELLIRGMAGLVNAARFADYFLADELELLEREMNALISGIGAKLELRPLMAKNPQLVAALVAASETIIEDAELAFTVNPNKAHSTRASQEFQSEQPFAAVRFIDIPEKLVEFINDLRAAWKKQWPKQDRAFAELQAFALSLAARAKLMDGDYLTARDFFDEALKLAGTMDKAKTKRTVWADWLPPEDLPSRIKLEFVRGLYPKHLSSEEMLAALPERAGWTQLNIDRDRFNSATYRLLLAQGVLSMLNFKQALDAWGISDFTSLPSLADEAIVAGVPVCNAHRSTPPLFATVADAVASAGYISPALELLIQIVSQTNRFGLETTLEAERLHLRIALRMRLGEVGDYSGSGLRESPKLDDQELLWTRDALGGVKNPQQFPSLPPDTDEVKRFLWLHAIWRTLFARDPERATQVCEWADKNLPVFSSGPTQPPSDNALLEAALDLDSLEARLLRKAPHDPLHTRLTRLVRGPFVAEWKAKYRAQPTDALRLILRFIALTGTTSGEETRMLDELVRRLGERRAAEIGLEEADLLALRLPEAAVLILLKALDWFEASGDSVGTIIAGIFSALIYERSNQPAELKETLERVRPAYERVSKLWEKTSNMPKWNQLQKFAGRTDLEELVNTWPRNWRPLLTRLTIALSYLDDGGKRLQGDSPFSEWLRASVGTPVGERGIALPSDFEGLLKTQPKAVAGDRKGAGASEDDNRLSLNITPLEHVSPALGYRSRITIPAVEITLTDYAQNIHWRGQTREVELTSYRKVSKALPSDFRNAIEGLRSRNPSAVLDITLNLMPELQGPCWEAMIGLNLDPDAFLPQKFPIHLHRTSSQIASRPSRKAAAQTDLIRILTPTASHVGTGLAERGWYVLLNNPRFSLQVSHPEIIRSSSEITAVQILHLVGAAEENFSSVWFNMSPDVSSRRIKGGLDAYSSGYGSGSMSVKGGGESFLISSEDLARSFPNLAMCVIQGVMETPGERTITDRRDAMLTRIFAADLFAKGVPLVLVIPPLQAGVAVSVLHILAGATSSLMLEGPALSTALLADTLNEIKVRIWEEDRESEADLESTLDVCLWN